MSLHEHSLLYYKFLEHNKIWIYGVNFMIITSYRLSNQNTNEFVLVNKLHTYIPYLQQKILPIKLFF